MEINRLAIAGLAAGCLATAGLGAYVATRHNGVEQSAPAVAVPAVSPDTAPGTPVTESEGVLPPADARESVVPAAAPAPEPRTSAPAPRPAPPARQAPAAAPRRASAPVTVNVPVVDPLPPAPTTSGGSMWEARTAVEPIRPEPIEPQAPVEPVREYVELTIPSDSVLGLQIERTVTSELALIEDRVEARVTRDVRVNDRVAIPAGAVVHGSVTDVDPGGKVRERAHLAIRFHTVVLADGTRLALRTDELVREGDSPGGASAAKIGGGAAAGAIIGGIFGGRRGAVIGGSVGAAGGTAAVMTGDRKPAVLASGSTVTVRILEPVQVTVER